MGNVSLHKDDVLEPFAARHLPYELMQLVGTAGALTLRSSISAPIEIGEHVKNALLDSFLMHLRALDDFLGARRGTAKTRTRDVLAVDFLPTWEPSRVLDKPVRNAVDAQLAHLSVHRVPGPDHPWYYLDLAHSVVEAFEAFVLDVEEAEKDHDHRWAPRLRSVSDSAWARFNEYAGHVSDWVSS